MQIFMSYMGMVNNLQWTDLEVTGVRIIQIDLHTVSKHFSDALPNLQENRGISLQDSRHRKRWC